MFDIITRLRGLVRSLKMYYWPPGQNGRIDAFYAPMIKAGDLCFDIGAHVGNRSLCFERLGARVIAVEPQPDFVRFLNWLFRSKPQIRLEAAAIGAEPGEVELFLSSATPTVTSGSKDFVSETPQISSFSSVVWNRSIRVPAVSLDQLAKKHGHPDFIKLDIEGMEIEALRGLEQPPALLSFEFLAARPQDTHTCLERLDELGAWQFNISRGEDLALLFDNWLEMSLIKGWIDDHAGQDFSGDIYARLN